VSKISKIIFFLFVSLTILYLGADFSTSEEYFVPQSAVMRDFLFAPFLFIALAFGALRLRESLIQAEKLKSIHNIFLTIIPLIIFAGMIFLKYFR